VVAVSTSSLFIRGIGGFGGERGPNAPAVTIPDRAPDATHSEKTSVHQACLYRLSADYNPIHVDPNMAALAGFKTPILHGLCTMGFASRAVLKKYLDNDPLRFKSIRVRFSSPVFPGETLVTEMWKHNNQIVFQVKVQERNVVVLSNGMIEDFAAASSTTAASAAPVKVSGAKSAAVFEAMKGALVKNPGLVDKVKAVYQFNLTGPNACTYTVDLKNAPGFVSAGPPPASLKPDCVLTISDDDYFDMANGKLDAQAAFLKGKLKIAGNIMLAQKLGLIQQAAAKM